MKKLLLVALATMTFGIQAQAYSQNVQNNMDECDGTGNTIACYDAGVGVMKESGNKAKAKAKEYFKYGCMMGDNKSCVKLKNPTKYIKPKPKPKLSTALSPVFNEFVCDIVGETNVFTLYENKTMTRKYRDEHTRKKKTMRGRWVKDAEEIDISFDGRYDGTLTLDIRRGRITYNNPEKFARPQKCWMK